VEWVRRQLRLRYYPGTIALYGRPPFEFYRARLVPTDCEGEIIDLSASETMGFIMEEVGKLGYRDEVHESELGYVVHKAICDAILLYLWRSAQLRRAGKV
jgi:hypothetical protein